jgi:hypothetical protein
MLITNIMIIAVHNVQPFQWHSKVKVVCLAHAFKKKNNNNNITCFREREKHTCL